MNAPVLCSVVRLPPCGQSDAAASSAEGRQCLHPNPPPLLQATSPRSCGRPPPSSDAASRPAASCWSADTLLRVRGLFALVVGGSPIDLQACLMPETPSWCLGALLLCCQTNSMCCRVPRRSPPGVPPCFHLSPRRQRHWPVLQQRLAPSVANLRHPGEALRWRGRAPAPVFQPWPSA